MSGDRTGKVYHKTLLVLLGFSSLIFEAGVAGADVLYRPKKPEEIEIKEVDYGVKVKSARVAWANYALIKRDFPELKDKSKDYIDRWLVANFAYVSEEQLKLAGKRTTKIEVDLKDRKKIHRPDSYGRAGVLEAEGEGGPMGLADVKGLGLRPGRADAQVQAFADAEGNPAKIRELKRKGHNDGAASLGEVLSQEVAVMEGVGTLAREHNRKHGTEYGTVSPYAALDYGFNLDRGDGVEIPAGGVIRQAHWDRKYAGKELPFKVETYGDKSGKTQNPFQTEKHGLLIDGGTLKIVDPRLKPHFIGNSSSGDAQESAIWAHGHDTALAFRGPSGRSAVDGFIRGKLADPLGELYTQHLEGEIEGAGARERYELYLRLQKEGKESDPKDLKAFENLILGSKDLARDGHYFEVLLLHMHPKNRTRLLKLLSEGAKEKLAEALGTRLQREAMLALDVEILKSLCESNEAKTRVAALKVVKARSFKNPKLIQFLLRATEDSAKEVRQSAEAALGSLLLAKTEARHAAMDELIELGHLDRVLKALVDAPFYDSIERLEALYKMSSAADRLKINAALRSIRAGALATPEQPRSAVFKKGIEACERVLKLLAS